jgi:hypothetical protein
MNVSRFGATCGVILALTTLSLASPSFAQQKAAPTPAAQTPAVPQPPAVQPPVVQTPIAPVAQSPAPAAAAQPAPASPAPESATSLTNSGSRSLKAEAAALRELSPWSMFLSADVLVKAVMIGLAFASLLTWTIFIAKMIELAVAQRKLKTALDKISDSRSLAEAQFALGAKRGVLSSFLAAAMREARMSAGISSDTGIKERAASSFDEINLESADHQSGGSGAWYRRGAARHRDRPGCGDPGRHHLQSLRAGDQNLSRIGQPGLGRGRAAAVARSRSHPCQFRHTFAGGGVGHGRIDRRRRV